jgi:hypothetical protein
MWNKAGIGGGRPVVGECAKEDLRANSLRMIVMVDRIEVSISGGMVTTPFPHRTLESARYFSFLVSQCGTISLFTYNEVVRLSGFALPKAKGQSAKQTASSKELSATRVEKCGSALCSMHFALCASPFALCPLLFALRPFPGQFFFM